MYEIQADVSAGMMCYSPRESEWDADISHGSRDSPLNAAVIKVDWAGGGLGWWLTGLVVDWAGGGLDWWWTGLVVDWAGG